MFYLSQGVFVVDLVGVVLTSLLGAELHGGAGGTLVVAVGHHHEHLVVGERHQVSEETGRLRHGAVEPFGLLLPAHRQTRDQTGVTPVVQLGGGADGVRGQGRGQTAGVWSPAVSPGTP